MTALFYDSQGTFLDSASGYVATSSGKLPAGETMCFGLLVTSPPPGWAYYRFEDVAYRRDGDPYPRLTTFNTSGSYRAADEYRIVGQIRNDDSRTLSLVQVVATLYDSLGRVRQCEYDNANNGTLSPGQVTSFVSSLYHTNGSVTSWRLRADGEAW